MNFDFPLRNDDRKEIHIHCNFQYCYLKRHKHIKKVTVTIVRNIHPELKHFQMLLHENMNPGIFLTVPSVFFLLAI